MVSRGVRGSDHKELERLINSIFDSDVEDSEGEDVQKLEDNFYRENNSDSSDSESVSGDEENVAEPPRLESFKTYHTKILF
ncbi:hypothetical protein C0J52_16361 [Blattella germanica]|nr:hypothetical protein C0J52_16361 [Blattella germanica]